MQLEDKVQVNKTIVPGWENLFTCLSSNIPISVIFLLIVIISAVLVINLVHFIIANLSSFMPL